MDGDQRVRSKIPRSSSEIGAFVSPSCFRITAVSYAASRGSQVADGSGDPRALVAVMSMILPSGLVEQRDALIFNLLSLVIMVVQSPDGLKSTIVMFAARLIEFVNHNPVVLKTKKVSVGKVGRGKVGSSVMLDW